MHVIGSSAEFKPRQRQGTKDPERNTKRGSDKYMLHIKILGSIHFNGFLVTCRG